MTHTHNVYSDGELIGSATYDITAATVTITTADGTTTRPMTDPEIMAYTPPPPAPREQLAAALAELTPPILPEDVAAVLTDLLEVI